MRSYCIFSSGVFYFEPPCRTILSDQIKNSNSFSYELTSASFLTPFQPFKNLLTGNDFIRETMNFGGYYFVHRTRNCYSTFFLNMFLFRIHLYSSAFIFRTCFARLFYFLCFFSFPGPSWTFCGRCQCEMQIGNINVRSTLDVLTSRNQRYATSRHGERRNGWNYWLTSDDSTASRLTNR